MTANSSAIRVLSIQEKQEFLLGTLPRMARYTFDFTCSVISLDSREMGRHIGSAMRCILNGRRAILTALHVIEEARRGPLGFAIATEYGQRPYVVHGAIDIDPFCDLAVYFLPDDYPSPETVFWPSGRLDRSLEKLSSDFLLVHGFPGTSSYPAPLFGGLVSRSLPYGAMQRLENLPPDLQPFQFAIEYDPVGMMQQTGEPQEHLAPHGLSGSPVWRIGISGRSASDWQPNDSQLVGIVTQWRPDERVLVATSTKPIPPSW